MPALRQGLRVDAGLQHARAHAQPGLCVSVLRQAFQSTVAAAGAHSHAHGREALQVPTMLQGVRRQVEPTSTHPDALGRQAVRVRPLRQGVRPQVVPVQARGVVMHAWAALPRVIRGQSLKDNGPTYIHTDATYLARRETPPRRNVTRKGSDNTPATSCSKSCAILNVSKEGKSTQVEPRKVGISFFWEMALQCVM